MPLLILSPRQSFKNKRTFAEISGRVEHRAPSAIESRRRGNESQIENREKFEPPHVVSYQKIHERGRSRLSPASWKNSIHDIRMSPSAPVGDVTWAKTSYNSIRKKIISDWKRDGEKFTL